MIRKIASIAALAGLGVVAYQLLRVRMPTNDRAPRPAHTYDDALDRLKRLEKADDEGVNSRCHTQLLTHGRRTERVTVLLHGYTNCPYQFLALGEQLHTAGHNVLIPRFPRHGLAPLSDEQGKLTVEDLVGLANDAVDIAGGLGEHVTVCGLSMGGALAAWVAQNRPDVDRVVALSPALAPTAAPTGRRRMAANLLSILPNFYRWRDPANHEPPPGNEHQYPRVSSRGLAVLLRLGQIVFYEAQRGRPAVQTIVIVGNPADDVVDPEFTAQVVAAWEAHGADIETRDLPADLELIHDYIDPTQPGQQVDAVYPILTELLV